MATNEVGFALCKTPGGQLVAGPVAQGTPRAVDIPVACPQGSTFYGLMHTHPGGISKLSATDVRSAVATKAQATCVSNSNGDLRCYRTRRK